MKQSTDILKKSLVIACCLALLSCSRSDSPDATSGTTADVQQTARTKTPNLILIITDDLTMEMLVALEPTQRLFSDGTTFNRATVAMPLCCPARATLLTGQWPHTHQVKDNTAPDGGFTVLDWNRTVATELRSHGYTTSHIGRTLNDYTVNAQPVVPPGWDDWYTPLEDQTRSFVAFGASMMANGQLYNLGEDTHSDEAISHITDRLLDKNLRSKKPFYLEVGTMAPHTARPRLGESAIAPVPAPNHEGDDVNSKLPERRKDETGKPDWVTGQKPPSRANMETYWEKAIRSLATVNELTQSIFDRLTSAGQRDNTVVVFTSDNGIALGEHNLSFDKTSPYEPSVNVPLMATGPGFSKGPTDSPVSHADIVPTMLQAAGLKIPDWVEGLPLQDTVKDPRKAATRVLSVEGPVHTPKAPPFSQIRLGQYVLTRYDNGELELSDLEKDPEQLKNFASDKSLEAVREQLLRLLERFKGCSGRECVMYAELPS